MEISPAQLTPFLFRGFLVSKPSDVELTKLEALQWNSRFNNLSRKLAEGSKEAKP